MSSNQINYLFQDSKGFVWISTDKGVSRFDGKEFKNFTSADGLESDEVFRIAEDRYHRIFFYCDNYKICFYENGKIQTLATNQKIILPPFASFFFNKYNELCINYGTKSQVFTFKELKSTPHANNANNTIYGATGETMVLSLPETKALTQEIESQGFYLKLPTSEKPYRLEISGNHLLFLSKSYILIYKKSNNQITPIKRIDIESDVNLINMTGKNTVAINTLNKGSYLINFLTGDRTNYLDNQITSYALIDDERNTWLGTFNNGLFLATNTNTKLINQENGLFNNNVQKLVTFKNQVVAGHVLSGLSYISKSQHGYTIQSTTLNQGRSDFNRITELYTLKDRQLVIGTDNGIWHIDNTQGEPMKWPIKLYSIGPTKGIIQRNDSTLYLTHRTLRITENWDKDYSWYDIDSLRLTSLVYYKSKPIIGTLHGLYQLHLRGINDHYDISRILPADVKTVKCLAEQGDYCAVGTENKGVILFGSNYKKQFNAPLISGSNIRNLIWTDPFTLWVCTSKGANVIFFEPDFKSYRVRYFNTSLGLPSENVADVTKHNGEYYIATDKGIAVVKNIFDNFQPPPKLVADIASSRKNRVKYGEIIQFNFTGISYKSLGYVTYKFRLKELDKNWISSNTGERRFDLLPPGNYTLQAVAIDRFNQRSNLIQIKFTIEALWYQQKWLQLSGLLLLILLVYLISRKYYLSIINLQKKDFEQTLALQQERQRISSEVHDDLGASISSIKLQTELLSKRTLDQPAFAEINKIHASISEISSQIRLIIWSLDTGNDELNSFIYFLREQIWKLMENAPLKFNEQINCPDHTNIAISGDKRRHIYLLVREAFNNIVKHADAKSAYLEITVNKKYLDITIQDDGKGFDENARTVSSMGLTNMYVRAKHLNAPITINSKENGGTVIYIQVTL